MRKQSFVTSRYAAILLGVLVLFGLYLTSVYSYALFHSLVELFSIIVACGIFIIAWNSRRFMDNNYLLFIGIAYLFIGGIDLVHTLAYKGMGIFQGYGATNLAAQLWISARYIDSISLLIAPLFLRRKLRTDFMFVGYAAVVFLLLASIFYWRVFPQCFVEGVGLTPFKIISEYVISVILMGAIGLLLLNRREFDAGVVKLLVAAMAVTIGSEMAFTLYVDAYGLLNMVGHFLKLISFYLIYRALIETGLTKPYNLLFRNLKQSEEALQKAKDGLEIRVAERTHELNKSNEQLQQEISERKRNEEHIRNLNEVLRALRGVNQLITKEKDRKRLIQQSCNLMVQTRGFLCAWILLFDEKRKFISAVVAGGEEMQAFYKQLEQDNYPPCVDRILAYKDSSAVCDEIVENRLDCLPRGYYSDGRGLISRLEYEGKVYGIVSVYVPSDYALDPEEQDLFRELAGDIAYALASIEKEEQRKLAEENIERLQRRNEMILNSAGEGIYGVDLEGKTTFANPAAAKLVGYEPAELIGQLQHALIHHTRPDGTPYPREECPIYEAFSDGHVHHVDDEIFWRKDGTSFPVEYTSTPIRSDRGNLTGAVVVFKDITERKKAAEERKNIQEQLIVNDRLASIGQLAAGITHEINNPLTSVISFSELLLRRDLPDDVKEDLKTINSEAQRIALVVRGLLTFARKQKAEKELVSVNDTISRVLQLRSYEQKVSNIEVNTRFGPDLPKIIGNSAQLLQVFINIIFNAEQAMLEGHSRGTLTIVTERVGDTVKASVADDGPGISPENMRKLFTPFFTTKEVGKGTGLGLSICHGIVTEHGGRIYAESEPGKGTTFVVELPINK